MDVYGRYELLEEIGRGGMAEVYLARLAGPLSISRFLALKRVLSDVSREIEVREMFVDEARLAMMLTHPNIVATYEFGEEERCYFLAMELVAGQDLRRVMRRCVERKRHVPADCACYIVAQVARALAYAHKLTDAQGKPLAIVHRDVTPSNVIISYDGAVKLTDFGVARAASRLRTNFTKVGELRGTPRYMSPEQAAGGALDSRSDLFSLTTILLELNVLHPAFHAKNEADSLRMVRGAHAPERDKYASEIPEDIARVVDKGMALDPQARFRDGDEMAEALEMALRRRSPGFGPTNLAGFMSSLFAEDRGLWLDRMKLYDTRTIVDATRHPPTDPKLTAPLPSAVGTRPGVALPAEVEAPDTDEMPASAEPRTTDEMLAAAEARSTDKMPAAPDLAAVEVRTVTGKRQGTTGPETPSSAAKSPSDPPTAAHKLSAVKRTPSGPTPMSPAEPAAVHVPSEMTRRSLAGETVVTLPGEKTDRVPPPREFPVWLASALVALTVFVVMVRLLAPRASSAHDGTSGPPAARRAA